MAIEIKQEDLEAVMRANPVVALTVENQALKRKLDEAGAAYDVAITANKRLTEELEKSKNGKSPKEK
tara:strand:+ start:653 stop:853 length:201 start_codon:yes stop_codon:yes gene_type:complete